MPTPINYIYYPSLSDLMKPEDLPDFLSFIKDGLQEVFDKMYYKDYQTSKSTTGSSAFYSLDIVSRKKLALELPGTGVFFVLNPDYSDSTISSFPITVFWEWEIMRYIRYFNLNDFSFSAEDFYNLTLQVLNISEEQIVQLAINTFVVQSDPSLSKFTQLVQDINELFDTTISIDDSSPNKVQELLVQLSLLDKKIAPAIFSFYLLSTDLSATKGKINLFFSSFIPSDIEEYIKEIITPKARVTLGLSAAVEFPRTILTPWKDNGGGVLVRDEDETHKTLFKFAEAQLYADTQAGIGYNLELAGTLLPRYSEIGKSGMLIQIESLKLDLSKKTNIPEADADGRPNDFTGIYARAVSVTLPSKWFHDDETQGTVSSTLRLGAYDLLVGTGGLSGTIFLETVPVQAVGGPFNYFNNKFSFNYPIYMFEKDSLTNEVVEKKIDNYTELTTYLQFLNTTDSPYVFKFPLSLTTSPTVTGTISPSTVYIFNTAQDYQSFLSVLIENKLWKKIGGDKGFKIGFKKFDITFKQNKVISSNIFGSLVINKFLYKSGPNIGQPVQIDVEGHIHDNGDFNLTASANPSYELELKDVLTYDVRSVELGKDGDDFYIGTSGKLKFTGVPLLDSLQAIDIDRLRIYSDGNIEIQGGSVQLAKPIVLPLGPVEITVSAIHYGSHQKEYNGVMRKFNYFGFDGGISIDPLGVEIRGDGVKYYYCTDNLPDKPHAYLHIQTLYIDLTIPASSPVAIINGWLSIPDPGTSPEYAGGIKIKLPKAKISGSADMKLMPKYPAFIIDAEIEFPVPIPLGTFAIYGFRGLIGYRYVAEKEAVGLVSGVNTWYEYYKAPPLGIHVRKFNGPNQTKRSGTPVSIGAGASLGTSFDDGTVLNIKAMVLLSIPSLFMIDGRAAIISARLGLDDSGDPPFFAFVALGDHSLEFGFGADFKLPKSGAIISLYADVEAGFFFNNSSRWYVNIGTRTNPITARILTLITLQSYLMLSAKGIEAGARGEFVFNKTYGPVGVKAWAYVEVGGKISFERPQIGGYLAAGVGAEINIRILQLYISIDLLFGAESPKPFLIYGKFRLCVKVKILFIKIKFCGEIEIAWEFNKDVDRAPLNPLINASSIESRIDGLVVGVNMLTNEIFDLAYLEPDKVNGQGIPVINNIEVLLDEIKKNIIPLDTYVDIKTEKGLLPKDVGGLIGGINNPPSRYTDLIPPDKVVRGKAVRQVKHQYTIEELTIKAWNGTAWVNYHPYKALYPNDTSGMLNSMKIGQWQKTDGQYNAVRLLATTPFSYTEQGEPGWYVPEQYGLTPGSLFCEAQALEPKCADFISKPLGHQYYCYDINHRFLSNDVAFMLLNSEDTDYAEITNESNVFGIAQSLQFQNSNKLEILLPEPSTTVVLRLTSFGEGVIIRYYSSLINDAVYEITYGHPETGELNVPYEIFVGSSVLNDPIQLDIHQFTNWNAISKIEILPKYPNMEEVNALQEQIAQIEEHNMQILLGEASGELQSTDSLEAQLLYLTQQGCGILPVENPEELSCSLDAVLCGLYNDILDINNSCLPDPSVIHYTNFTTQAGCVENILNLIKNFNALHPEYNLQSILDPQIIIMYNFAYASNPDLGQYTNAWNAVQFVLNYLNVFGDCNCKEPVVYKCYSLLHKVCWLSLEDYEYNINIPAQEDIDADSMATVAGITQFIQPIWRPDTSYVVHFKLKDTVDNGAGSGTYPFTYGFSTAGPVGFFHTHENSKYGVVKVDSTTYLNETTGLVTHTNGVPSSYQEPTPDKYPLTSLRQYIDYNRSYPNADGNLLGAKPLFYDDSDNTKISLYFAKAYATHFFQDWENYPEAVLTPRKGRQKIVIKDPREDVSIVNPPSLDSIIETVNIPQTIEEWTTDNEPLVPFVLSQWINLFLADNCVGVKPQVIVPASQYISVTLKKLKPQKLYTAIVNNMYDLNKDGHLGPIPDPSHPENMIQQEETREVHRFGFQTSRYRNFNEQIMSYILDEEEEVKAIFQIDKSFNPEVVNAAYQTINGASLVGLLSSEIVQRLNTNYQHAYDRIFEGIFGFQPLDEAVTTEFNIIRNTEDSNKVIAVIVRNPEPFNNPRMTIEALSNTIAVLQTGNVNPDTNYHVLFSKDCSQAIIMHSSLGISADSLRIGFTYKTWNGASYVISNSEVVEILL